MSKEDAELYDKMLKKLEELDEKPGKKKTPENQARDILIALTCMKNCLTLVTNDNNLKKVAQEFQCSAITFEQLLKGEYREFKDTEIGKIPKEWNIVKLEKICNKIKAGGTPLTTKKEFWNGGIPFVKIEDITSSGKYLTKTSNFITKIGLENSNAWIIPANSLLLAMYGSLGEVSINRINVATNQAILGIIPKEEDDVEFLYYWFLYFKPNWKRYAKPTTQANLTAEIVKNSLTPLPRQEERKKIAEILSAIDKKLEIERNEKTRLERIKQAMMDLLLTGKIRIR
jgi:type I restriction enzyme S subunit